jgi:lipoprotein-releasing system permease protein
LNLELFIVRKIAFSNPKSFSSFIIRIAIAAVALSLSTMIISTSMVNGFQHEIRNKVTGFWSHLMVQPYSLSNYLLSEPVYVHQDFYDHPSIIPEARHIQVTALKAGILKTKDDFEGIVLKGAGPDFDWNNFKPYLKQGSVVKPGTDSAMQQVIISGITAKRLHLQLNDRVLINFKQQASEQSRAFTTRKFYITGIYETGLEEFDARYVITDIAVIQELNHWGPDTVGGFEIFLKEGNLFKSRTRAYFLTIFGSLLSPDTYRELSKDPLDIIGEQVYSRMSNSDLDVTSIKTMNPGIFDWLDIQSLTELIILSLMLVVAVINMITALLILILERSNMIGILKALGARGASIRSIFIYYSAVIIALGLIIGNVAGIGLCLAEDYFHFVKLPQESYYLSYAPVQLNWAWIAGMNICTIFITLLLLLIPAMLVSAISPLKAIRFS